MAGSIISGKVTNSVTLGSAGYPSPLTVAATGDVAVSANAGIGIYGPASSGTLINDGTVAGGAGSASSSAGGGGGGTGGTGTTYGGDGGSAGYLAAGAVLTNQSTIAGGGGGYGTGGPSAGQGTGGPGVVINGGTLDNTSVILGDIGLAAATRSTAKPAMECIFPPARPWRTPAPSPAAMARSTAAAASS
jgi:hypothetical protein